MQFPKLTIDVKALKIGFWGNTWKNWGYILLAFLALYAIEAGYFTGMLFASKGIRGTAYKTLTSQYFGSFEQANIPLNFTYPEAHSSEGFNRPDGCVTVNEQINIAGDTIERPTGVQRCYTNNGGSSEWTLFPWVADTNAAGKFPGCSGGVTVLTQETSPAFNGDVTAPPEVAKTVACQNFVPTAERDYLAELVPATAPSAGKTNNNNGR